MATLFTNVGCPVEVTGQPAINEQMHITFPTGVEIDMRVVLRTSQYVILRSDYDNDEETTRFRLYFAQEDCPDREPEPEPYFRDDSALTLDVYAAALDVEIDEEEIERVAALMQAEHGDCKWVKTVQYYDQDGALMASIPERIDWPEMVRSEYIRREAEKHK